MLAALGVDPVQSLLYVKSLDQLLVDPIATEMRLPPSYMSLPPSLILVPVVPSLKV